jgi:hypothetical protein
VLRRSKNLLQTDFHANFLKYYEISLNFRGIRGVFSVGRCGARPTIFFAQNREWGLLKDADEPHQ